MKTKLARELAWALKGEGQAGRLQYVEFSRAILDGMRGVGERVVRVEIREVAMKPRKATR